MTYGKNFFSRTGGKHFVIDTVRNGLPQPTQLVMRPAQMGSGGEALRLHSRFSRGRLPLDQAARRVGRLLQRRSARRPVVGWLRPQSSIEDYILATGGQVSAEESLRPFGTS